MVSPLAFVRARALVAASRQISTSSARSEVHPGYFKFKEEQKKFQVDNGLRVHERGGPRDKIIYNITLLLGAVVGYGILDLMYRGMFPRGLKRGLLGIED